MKSPRTKSWKGGAPQWPLSLIKYLNVLGRRIGCGEPKKQRREKGAHRNGRFPKSSPVPRWVGKIGCEEPKKTET